MKSSLSGIAHASVGITLERMAVIAGNSFRSDGSLEKKNTHPAWKYLITIAMPHPRQACAARSEQAPHVLHEILATIITCSSRGGSNRIVHPFDRLG